MSHDCVYEPPAPRRRKASPDPGADAAQTQTLESPVEGRSSQPTEQRQTYFTELGHSAHGANILSTSIRGPSSQPVVQCDLYQSDNIWSHGDWLSEGNMSSFYSLELNSFYKLPYMDYSYPTFSSPDPAVVAQDFSHSTIDANDPLNLADPQTFDESHSTQEQNNDLEHDFHDSANDRAMAFTQAPGSMNTGVRKFLLSYFRDSVSPPASLVSMDPGGWHRLRSHLLTVSSRNEAAEWALLAVAELYAEQNAASVPQQGQRTHSLSPMRLQQISCQGFREDMKSSELSTVTRNDLLAVIFLLAWFEVVCDVKAVDSATFPQDIAQTIITSKGEWYPQSRLILKCLNSIDAKASYMGGRPLLSAASLGVIFDYRFEVENELGDERGESEDDNDSEPIDGAAQEPDRVHERPPPEQISPSNSGTSSAINKRSTLTRILKMNIFNAIVQPGLEFHIVSQRYCRRISSLERYHRTRDTVEDEYVVVTTCKEYENELKSLWERRPRVLDLTMTEISQTVSRDVAQTVASLFCVYVVTFWSHFIHIHRTAWWNLPLSQLATKAVSTMWRMMRQQNGQNGGLPPSDEIFSPPGRGQVLHPGFMWSLMLFGSECKHPDQQRWAVRQLRDIGSGADPLPNGNKGAENRPPGPQNAFRSAILLEELIKRQAQSDARVHFMDLSLEMFGCRFSII